MGLHSTIRHAAVATIALALLGLATAGCGSESEPAADTSVSQADAMPDQGGTPQSGTLAAFCAAVGDTGCCAGSRVVWCESGSAVAIECAQHGCGWDQSFYNCYASASGPPGSPRTCPGASDGACVPECTGRCGVPDGCGGTCGCSDLLGKTCVDGVCASTSTPTTCETVAHVGCCDGDTLRVCNAGAMTSQTCSNGCGWLDAGYYGCGGTAPDPAGVWPMACP